MDASRRARTAAVLGSLVIASSVVALPSAQAAGPKCFGKQATHVGTHGNDSITGTSGRDVIVARGGHDDIVARGGNDLICAGKGSDFILGGRGRDKIKGARGFDFIDGQGGHDLLRGGKASETIFGGRGNDHIILGPGFFQFAVGGGGNDTIEGSPFPDCASYFNANGPVDANLEQGIATGHGTDMLIDMDCLDGSVFDDVLTGNSAGNFLFGGPGDDTVNTGGNGGSLDSPTTVDNFLFDFAAGDTALGDLPPGDDTIVGGPGLNIVDYEEATEPVEVNFETGVATGEGTDVLSDINGVVGSSLDDTFIGSDADELFDGLFGNNNIDGGGGTDVLVLFDYQDAVANLLDGTYSGNLRTFEDENSTAPAEGTLTSIEDVWGSQFDDDLTGNNGPNRLFGGFGNDILNGLGGDDLLDGGEGTNTFDGGTGDDACLGEGSKTDCETSALRSRASVRSGFLRARASFTNWRGFRLDPRRG